MKKLLRIMLITISIILVVWTALTIWVELPKGSTVNHFGDSQSPKKALIVYNPDPIYNLDEQVCNAFGKKLSENNIYVTVSTVKAAKKRQMHNADYDLYVFCANTYNWRPDMPTKNFVKKVVGLKDKYVVAITLGSGSTKESKAAFEKTINENCDHLLFSETYWLLRPNDEKRMKEKNVHIAIDEAEILAKKTADIINN